MCLARPSLRERLLRTAAGCHVLRVPTGLGGLTVNQPDKPIRSVILIEEQRWNTCNSSQQTHEESGLQLQEAEGEVGRRILPEDEEGACVSCQEEERTSLGLA